jgi:O-antigen/teichoic acid export membrane protein
LDQGLFSASNFGVNILLARWLTPGEYGAFTVAYTAFLLVATFHTAMLIEPMLVFGAGDHRDRFGAYLRQLLRDHRTFAAFLGAIVLSLVGISTLTRSALAPLVLSLGIATPSILLLWLVRKACYVVDAVHLASAVGGAYLVLLVGSTYWLQAVGALGVATALLAIAACSLISGLALLKALDGREGMGEAVELRDHSYRASHFDYGKWTSGTLLLGWLRRDVYYLILLPWGGLQEVARLKALMNLLLPYLQGTIAVSTVLLPQFVRDRSNGVDRLVHATILFLGAGIVYGALIGLFGDPIVTVVYAARYEVRTEMLLLLALIPVAAGLVAVLTAWLKAGGEVRPVFRANLFGTLSLPIVGIPVIVVLGALGAVVGMVASYLAVLAFVWLAIAKLRRADPTSSSSPGYV